MVALLKFLKEGGYACTTGPLGIHEQSTFTCKHCCRVTYVEAGCDPVEMGGRCTCCDALICKHCVGKPCDHIERKLQRWETRRSIYEDQERGTQGS